MTNLEQIRASHALARSPNLDRNDVQKLPALIINNGLLAATAFTLDSQSREAMKKVMNAVAHYLSQRGLIAQNQADAKGIINDLTGPGRGPLDLQRATSEALAYLAYLKRFAGQGRVGLQFGEAERAAATPPQQPSAPTLEQDS
jgi:CRISPR-associated protein Cmr5